MAKMNKVDVFCVNRDEVLKKPIVIKFWSPVKECNCEIRIESVSANNHYVTFKYKDVMTGKWTSNQCRWNCLADAMDDACNDMRLWSTEVYHD